MSTSARHIVVIGAGMGGLSAALGLASDGHSVSVFERHPAPGGKIRKITIDGRGIDSGPTVFTMRWVFEDLFSGAGQSLDDHLSLQAANVLARHSWPDQSRLDLFADVERSADAIRALSGESDARAYRRFARESEDIFNTLDHSFMRRSKPSPASLSTSMGLAVVPKLLATKPFATLWNELGKIFSDPKLRQLFGRYATYTGSSPFEAPATLMLIAHAERAGVWRVEGGMQRLAEAMAEGAIAAGADIHYDSHVAGIRRAGDGLEVELAEGASVKADAVIFNGDVAALDQGLLGQPATKALASRARESRSLSAITWSMLAKVSNFPLEHHTVFFGEDYPDEFSSIFERKTVTRHPTVYICAQDRAAERAAETDAPERLFILINAPAATLSEDALDRHESDAFRLLADQGLHLDPSGESVVRNTPSDFARRFPGSDGAIYGWPTHGWSGSFKRSGSETRLPGLYCAGGTVHPGPGIPMATLSGKIAADEVRRYLKG